MRGGVAAGEGVHEGVDVQAAGGAAAVRAILHEQRVAGVLLQFVADDRDHHGRAHRRRAGAGNAAGVAGHVALGPGGDVGVARERVDDAVAAKACLDAVFQHVDHGGDAHRCRARSADGGRLAEEVVEVGGGHVHARAAQRRAVEGAGARLPLGDGDGHRAAHGGDRRGADAVHGGDDVLFGIRRDLDRARGFEGGACAHGGLGSAVKVGNDGDGADGGVARARQRRADVVKLGIAKGGNFDLAARGDPAARGGGNGILKDEGVRARADRRCAGDAEGEAGEGHLRARLRRHADIAAGEGDAIIADAGLHAVFQHLHDHGRADAGSVADVQATGEVV